MILTELQQFVAGLHSGDAYFGAPPGCAILWDGQKEAETKNLQATGEEIERILNDVGAVALVSEVEIVPVDGVFAQARLSVIYIENIALNRGPNGTGKTANQLAQKGWALCADQQQAPWSPLVFEGLVPAKVNQEGFTAWELQLQSTTLIDVLATAIGTQLEALLVNEEGKTLNVTPTDP